MAVAWTDITNAQVASGAAITTALMTALRDNPEGIAQRASGAPKIFGNAYDYQLFTANGTWTKPSNAETGDRVVVHLVGGGGAGIRTNGTLNGGGGGGGVFHTFKDIDDLPSTVSVTIGAGVAAPTGNPGSDGGDSLFGTSDADPDIDTFEYLEAEGGTSGSTGGGGTAGGKVRFYNDAFSYVGGLDFCGGDGGDALLTGEGGTSVFGGGGGGGAFTMDGSPGLSAWAGRGGRGLGTGGTAGSGFLDGEFPGGGGGAVNTAASGDTVAGAGGDGMCQVWCIREEA